jgi:DHA1 family tetracycline resistance protein-like MFS transporter
MFATYSLMQFVFAPIWGRISDRIGRRPILLLSLSGSAVGFLIFGLAENVLASYGQAAGLATLFFARIWAGIFTAGGLAAAYAYIADITTAENRAKGMGLLGAAFGLGFVFGPITGAFLSQISLQTPPFVAAGLCAANFLVAIWMLPESLSENRRGKLPPRKAFSFKALAEALRREGIGPLLLVFFFMTFAFSNLEATFALFLAEKFKFGEKEATQQTGYVLFYLGILVCIVQGGLIGVFQRVFGERKLVWAGTFFTAVTLALLPAMPTIVALCALMTPMALAQGLSTPSLNSLLTQETDPSEHGGILGLSQGLSSLARVFGPAWGGVAFEELGYAAPYLTGAVFMMVAFFLSSRIRDPQAVSIEQPDWNAVKAEGAPALGAPPSTPSAEPQATSS